MVIWHAFVAVAIIVEGMQPTARVALREYDSGWDLTYPDVKAASTNELSEWDRPMFRFTIRELVLLTIIMAMGVGWWLDHRKIPDRETALGAPDDADVIDEWERLVSGTADAGKIRAEYERGTVSIKKEKVQAWVEDWRDDVEMEHTRYQCVIDCPPAKLQQAVFLDRTYVIPRRTGRR